MSFRKNALNYIVWIIFMMCNLVVFSFLSMLCAKAVGGPLPITAIGMVAAFFGVLFLIYLITGFVSRNIVTSKKESVKDKGIRTRLIIEGILMVCILAAGVFLRIYLLPTAGESAAYFDVAKVTQDQNSLLVPVQNSVYYYLCLLRGVFLLFGNHWIAGIWLQIALQFASAILLYFVVRKMTSVFAAIVVLGFIMFSPSSVKMGLMYSPDILYFLFWTLGLLFIMLYLIASMKQTQKESPWNSAWMWFSSILLGIMVAFLTYIDVTGAVLLVPLFMIPMVLRKNRKLVLWTGRMMISLISAVGAFFGFIYLDGILSNSEFFRVMRVWALTFTPKFPDLIELMHNSTIEVLILLIFIAFNIFSFYRRKSSDVITLWTLMTFSLAACYVLGITTENMSGRYLLLTMMCLMAATGVREMCYVEPVVLVANETEKVCKFVEGDELIKTEANTDVGLVTELNLVSGEMPISKPRFLDNPLPLPKKHVKKKMDYAFVPETSQMKYDIEVSEMDDFDV